MIPMTYEYYEYYEKVEYWVIAVHKETNRFHALPCRTYSSALNTRDTLIIEHSNTYQFISITTKYEEL